MKYSQEKTQEICKRLSVGLNREDAATLSDISKETFYQWLKKPDFSDAIKKAELKCKERNVTIIQKAGITTWQAAAWWLERKHHNEFALKNIMAHEGKDGEPIIIKVVNYGSHAAV